MTSLSELGETRAIVKLYDKALIDFSDYGFQDSSAVIDYVSIHRTWKERLFTVPWAPWRNTKASYSPVMHVIREEKLLLVSHRTYTIFIKLTHNYGGMNV